MPGATYQRYIVQITNTGVDSSNVAQFGIELAENLADPLPEQTAQIVAYATSASYSCMANGVRLAGILYYAVGSNLGVQLPFPATEYAAIRAATTGLPAMTDWNDVDFDAGGSRPLTPLGTSIVVSEYTGVGGPRGRGRHYLPFPASNTVDAGGRVALATRTAIEESYNQYIKNVPATPPLNDIFPVVGNAAGTTELTVTNVKAQPVFSNLESRRR